MENMKIINEAINMCVIEIFCLAYTYILFNKLLQPKNQIWFVVQTIKFIGVNLFITYMNTVQLFGDSTERTALFLNSFFVLLVFALLRIYSDADYLHIFIANIIVELTGTAVVIMPFMLGGKITDEFIGSNDIIVNGQFSLSGLIITLLPGILVGLLFVFISFLLKKHNRKFVDTKIKYKALWWIIVISEWVYGAMNVIKSDIVAKRYATFLDFAYAIIAVLAMYEVSLWVRRRNEKRIRQENQILSVENAVMKEYYSTLEYQLDYTRKFRHDIEKHMAVIKEMITNQDAGKKLIEYTSQIQESCEGIAPDEYCKNPIVNAILVNKKKQCDEKGIKFEILVDKFELGKIREIDMIAVFANVLDNAIEECGRITIENKKITLKSYVSEEKLILKVSNSTEKTEMSNEFKTEKEDSYGHGVGLSIVNEIVEKYSGTFEMNIKEDRFEVVIRLEIE